MKDEYWKKAGLNSSSSISTQGQSSTYVGERPPMSVAKPIVECIDVTSKAS